MGVEIERKFLVCGDVWRRDARPGVGIVQGYLANTTRSSVRVRMAGDAASLSVKGMTPGLRRDEFGGANAGLVVAELELAAPDEPFVRPAWLGEEVTDHVRYYNFRLVTEPFAGWPAADREAARAGRHLDSAVEETS